MTAVERDTKYWIQVIVSEKRRYPRFKIQLPVEYYQDKLCVTHIGNISEAGLLIYLPEEIEVGQFLRLRLFFSFGSELNVIKLMVEVVWKGDPLDKEGEYYPYGVTFVDISLEDWRKLRKFLRTLSSPLDKLLYRADDSIVI